jgi:selenophosphate synthase
MIKLTEYSHGQGCGCKISPKILDKILVSSIDEIIDPNLLVGNNRISRSNSPKSKWVVNNRHKKVGSANNRFAITQIIHGSIITGMVTH